MDEPKVKNTKPRTPKAKPGKKEDRFFGKSDVAAKMKNTAVRTKDNIKNLSDDGQVTPNEYAQDNIRYITEDAAHDAVSVSKGGIKKTYNSGKRIVRDIKDKHRTAENIKQTAKSTGRQTFKTMHRDIKTAGRSAHNLVKTAEQTSRTTIKTTQKAAKTAQKSAKAAKIAAQKSAKAAKAAARSARETARAAYKGAVVATKAVISAIKGIIAGTKALIAAIASGGSVAVIIIVVIVLVALIVGSCFGIFFSNQPSESVSVSAETVLLSDAVTEINEEFAQRIRDIQNNNSYDDLEITSDNGSTSINWVDVLSVFAVKSTTGDNAASIAVLNSSDVDGIRRVVDDMNAINHTIRTVTDTVYVNTVDEYGNPITVEQTVTRRILSITITHKSYEDMVLAYGFNDSQKEQLYLLNDEKNKDLWDELLAGLIDSGTGEILSGSSARVPNNIFSWPLEEAGTITSYFGYRNDPFTGRVSYHCSTDIAMPAGTPILAAADGTVTVANSTDSWGGSYGYYVKIHHNDTYDSLYAHCSSICVTYGQTVQKGQVIGYVGTTGNSTGNHLHFEIWKNGSRTNALDYFG